VDAVDPGGRTTIGMTGPSCGVNLAARDGMGEEPEINRSIAYFLYREQAIRKTLGPQQIRIVRRVEELDDFTMPK
jgi:hypothetical protein